MLMSIMSDNDLNFCGSEDIVSKGDPHWPRTQHSQRHTKLPEQHNFRNRFASNFGNLATDEEQWAN